MTEASFAQRMVWGSRLKHPDPIITAPEPIFVDQRNRDVDKQALESPICYGSYDGSSLCHECDKKEECIGYTEILKEEKTSSSSSFEVK